MKRYKSVIYGSLAALTLLSLYFAVNTIFNSFKDAVFQFLDIWYWIIFLSAGFGVQVGLFSYIKFVSQTKKKGLTAEVTASGGVSTVSMIACCAHYLVGVLPFIGLSATALFLVKYQISFLLIGIFSNILGIIIMLMNIQNHKLYDNSLFFKRITNLNLKTIFYSILILAIFVPLSSFILINKKNNQMSNQIQIVMDEDKKISDEVENVSGSIEKIKLESQTDTRNSISIEVLSENFTFYEPFEFLIRFNTHSGNLGFEVDKITFLEDSEGNIYNPISWDGDTAGGHHRSGKLLFKALNKKVSIIQLTIKNIYGIEERVFKWELPG